LPGCATSPRRRSRSFQYSSIAAFSRNLLLLDPQSTEIASLTDTLTLERESIAKRLSLADGAKAALQADLTARSSLRLFPHFSSDVLHLQHSEKKIADLYAGTEQLHQEIFENVHENEKARAEQDKTINALKAELSDFRNKLDEATRKATSIEKDRDNEKARRTESEKDAADLRERIKKLEADIKAEKEVRISVHALSFTHS